MRNAGDCNPARGAELFKKIQVHFEKLRNESLIEEYWTSVDLDGSNRKIFFSFLYDNRSLQGVMKTFSGSEKIIEKSELQSKDLFILAEDVTFDDVLVAVNEIKFSSAKGYEREKTIFEIIKKMKNDPLYKIEEVLYSTEFEDFIEKIDLKILVNYFPKDSINQKIQIWIPLQIKSSTTGQKRHKEKRPLVPSIVVYSKTTDDEYVDLIKRVIKNYVHFFFKKQVDPMAKPEGFHL